MEYSKLESLLAEYERKMNKLADHTSDAILNLCETRSLERLIMLQAELLLTLDANGNSPIHLCIINRNFDLLEILAKAAATKPQKKILSIRNNQYLTPLLLAVHLKESVVCELLLKYGADINEHDSYSNCINIAASNQDINTLNVLLDNMTEGDIESSMRRFNNNGKTALQIAAGSQACCSSVLKRLLSIKNIDVNCKDLKNGYSALHYAVEENNLKCCKLLAEHITTVVDTVSYTGITPLQLAIDKKHYLITALLLRSNASISNLRYYISESFLKDSNEDICHNALNNSQLNLNQVVDDPLMMEILKNKKTIQKCTFDKIFKYEMSLRSNTNKSKLI